MIFIFIVIEDNSRDLDYVLERFNQTYNDKCKIQTITLDYQKVREQIPVIGVWDDHDYGLNDGGGDFNRKHLFRDIFLNFIEEPANTQRRLDTQNGIYQSKINSIIYYRLLD